MRKIFSALKNYFKEVMQNFERKGKGKKGKENRFICL